MFKNILNYSKTIFGSKSHNNLSIQNSKIEHLYAPSSANDLIGMLADNGNYEAVNKYTMDIINKSKQAHPLYPHFSASVNYDLNKLVSTPESEEALKLYPKNIKGTFTINYNEYPYMEKSEKPWDYAYRTQTKVTMKTTNYQEYLGDNIDPFPYIKFTDEMLTTITPPPFPDPVIVSFVVGELVIPMNLERKPCMEYGKLVFETVDENFGFKIRITTHNDDQNIKFIKNYECDLKIQVEREKILNEIYQYKYFSIIYNGNILFEKQMTTEEASQDFFKTAKYFIMHYTHLLYIEEALNCKFPFDIKRLDLNAFKNAHIIAASLQGIFLKEALIYENTLRCSYKDINKEILALPEKESPIDVNYSDVVISLYGIKIKAKRGFWRYENARINNLDSVEKNIKRRKKDILITFRPKLSYDTFTKIYFLEEISL